MENEKLKKTYWTIHSRGNTQSIELQYSELMGVPQSIKFSITSKDSKAIVEMTPSEFQKTYLIFQSFHDLLLSSDNLNEDPSFHQELLKKKQENIELHQDRDINTDEWDPW